MDNVRNIKTTDGDQQQNDESIDAENDIVMPVDNADLQDKIKTTVEKVAALADKRSSINNEVAAVLDEMKAAGIPKAAFKLALKLVEMDESQLIQFDIAYNLVRKALGKPVQTDLFLEKTA